jgi:hypothetical protein
LLTGVRHFGGRLTMLLNWNMLPETVSASVIRDLITRLQAIEQRAVHCVSNLSEDGAVSERMMQHDTELLVYVSMLTVRNRRRRWEVPTLPHLFKRLHAIFLGNKFRHTRYVSSLDNSIAEENVLVLPWHFKKLPHPAERILIELPLVNGLDVNFLLQFLKKVLEIRAVFTVTDQVLLQVTYPYCKEPLSNHVQQARNSGWGFDELHDHIIFLFHPSKTIRSSEAGNVCEITEGGGITFSIF